MASRRDALQHRSEAAGIDRGTLRNAESGGFGDALRFLLLPPLVGLACVVALRVMWARGRDKDAFLASAGTIVGILFSAAAGLFPRLLPSQYGSSGPSLDIYNTAAPAHSQRVALGIYVFGMVIVVIYLTRIYRVWKGKIESGESYHP